MFAILHADLDLEMGSRVHGFYHEWDAMDGIPWMGYRIPQGYHRSEHEKSIGVVVGVAHVKQKSDLRSGHIVNS